MEIYKRKVGYEGLNYRVIDSSLPITASSYLITATTLYFPIMLTQNFEDIGLYTDSENPVYEIVDFSGVWNLSNNGSGQAPCLILNNCSVSFTSTPITFFNANNGSITATINGCPGPQTFEWTGPNGYVNTTNLTITSLVSGNYTLKVTDGNCNITFASYFLTQPQSLSSLLESNNSLTNVTSPGGCNGSASIVASGGQSPYTYTWYSYTPPAYTASTVIFGPSPTITGLTSLCAGQYSVQVVDAGNTTVSQFFTVSEPSPITGSVVSTTNITCASSTDGSITVLASGGIHPTGYTYVLSGPVSSTVSNTGNANFNNLPVGNYNIQMFDSVGNSTILGPVILTGSTPVVLSLSSTNNFVSSGLYNIGCFGSTNGTMTITPNGGTAPYSIEISREEFDGNPIVIDQQAISSPYTLIDLDVSIYKVTIVDSNGCSGPTQTLTLKQKPVLNVSINTINTLNGYNIPCFGNTTGITVNTSYTVGNPSTISQPGNNIKYYVDNVLKATVFGPSSNVPLTNIAAGTHTLTVVDTPTIPGTTPSCSATTTFTLTQPPMPLSISYGVIDIEDSSIPGCGVGPNSCRQAVIDINGGVAPYTITWTGGLHQTGIPGNSITSNPDCAGQTVIVTVKDANGCIVGPTSITLT